MEASTFTESDFRQRIGDASPKGLKTFCTWPEVLRPAPSVVLVHGSLDRGTSFTRAIHRLDGVAVCTYDRRGYQASRAMGPSASFDEHVADLLAICAAADLGGGVVAVGHSFGGVVVQAAALAEPGQFRAIGAYEPPMPWLGFRRSDAVDWPPLDADPGVEAEGFFRRMVGDAAWDRLADLAKDDKRADGPALVQDLVAIRSLRFDPTQLAVPSIFGVGGSKSIQHHRDAARYLEASVPGARLVVIDDAGHGAHVSHPDRFAEFVEAAIAAGSVE